MQQPKKRPHPLLYNLLEDKGGRVEKKQLPPTEQNQIKLLDKPLAIIRL